MGPPINQRRARIPPELPIPRKRKTCVSGGAVTSCLDLDLGVFGESSVPNLSYADRVKVTRYFELRMVDRSEIRPEWCMEVLARPLEIRQQSDGKYQMWGYIETAEKYLRVITLEDRETVDNAFFDRRYARGRSK